MTVRHAAAATGGLRTTTAPAAPAQPARTTPRAQTTALASDIDTNGIAARMNNPHSVEIMARETMALIFKLLIMISLVKYPPRRDLAWDFPARQL